MYTDLTDISAGPEKSIRQVLAQIDGSRKGIVLVLDPEGRLLGIVTDGDMRRAVLARLDLGDPITAVLTQKGDSEFAQPVTAPDGSDSANLLQTLRDHSIRHLPLVDQDQRVVSVVTLDDFVAEQESSVQAMIMAGGLGLRMRPLTEELPKPMLQIGGRPLLETIVEQLRNTGINQINIAVNHKLEKIVEHFGDGHAFGVDITYAKEDEPLGTAGALSLIKKPEDTILVINGDVLTQVDFNAMLAFHREHQADLTIAITQHEFQIPFGVVECDGPVVVELSEKPMMSYPVNSGIYLIEPSAYSFIPNGKRFDMTELVSRLLEEDRPVVAFPIREYWIDVGQLSDYEQAQADFPEITTGEITTQ